MKNLIVDMLPRLAEIGKIKIGGLGDEKTSKSGSKYRMPEKYDHFVITKNVRDDKGGFERDTEAHAILGEKPTVIPIRFLFNDLDLIWQTRYVCYDGKKLVGRGDGELFEQLKSNGEWVEIPRPEKQLDPGYTGGDKWKPSGTLSCVLDIPSAGVGGVWRFRTTSFNSISFLTAGIMLIASQTGGYLANIPLELALDPKRGVDPKGNPVTVYVVSIRFRGSIEQLQTSAYKALETNKKNILAIEMLEKSARKELEDKKVLFDEETTSSRVLSESNQENQPKTKEFKPSGGLDFNAPIEEVEEIEAEEIAEIAMTIEDYKAIVKADLDALGIKEKQQAKFFENNAPNEQSMMILATSEETRKLAIAEELVDIINIGKPNLVEKFGIDKDFIVKLDNIPTEYDAVVTLYKEILEKIKK